jgi:hypothetical protein
MPQLTEERFEQIFTQRLEAQTKDLKKYMDSQSEDLAPVIAETIATSFTKRFDRLEELLEVKEDVLTLKSQMLEIRAALHLGA